MSEEGYIDQLLDFLRSRSFHDGEASIIPVLTHPWNVASVVNRLSEELGILDFIVLTRKELVDDIYQSLSQEPAPASELNIYVDHMYAKSILHDSVFDNAVRLQYFINNISDRIKRIYIDLTLTTGPFAVTLQGVFSKTGSPPIIYTYVDTIPLPGLPQYPSSPRWMHRVYVYDDESHPLEIKHSGAGNKALSATISGKIMWKGTRGIFEDISRIMNKIIDARIMEKISGEFREDIPESSPVLVVNALNPVNGERKKIISLKLIEGPDENSVNMMMSNWKILSELVYELHQDADKSSIERILMQFQRYTGAVDLIARELEGQNARDYEGWKMHSLLVDMYRRLRRPIALLPDTNMFYQGLHMTLLKASIKNGKPWNPIDGVRIYIPVCAEAEINGKVAGVSSETTGISKYSYIMALLANRAIDEIKQYYKGVHLPAVSQPCEASIAVVEQGLSEERIILVTADKKAYNAWVTLNVCRDRVICIYVGHRNKPLNIDGLYSKFYASIVLTSQIYVASSIIPLELSMDNKRIRIVLETLQGAGAPVLNIIEEPTSYHRAS